MPLEINRSFKDGNTVPYGPIFDDIRKNYGFSDLRGRPHLAEKIFEGASSRALRNLLVRIARERSYFSLGCDLGRHVEDEQPPIRRNISSGYIQISSMTYAQASTDQYDTFCEVFGKELKRYAGKQRWRIDLQGRYVQFNMPGEPAVKAPSIWMWFFAAAKTHETSDHFREDLLAAIERALHADQVRQCLSESS